MNGRHSSNKTTAINIDPRIMVRFEEIYRRPFCYCIFSAINLPAITNATEEQRNSYSYQMVSYLDYNY